MNKSQLVAHVATELRTSRLGAARLVDAVLGGVERGLREDRSVTIAGFGTFEVKDRKTLLGWKRRLEKKGLDVVGPTDHHFIESIYFFDPNGHRLELAARKGGKAMLKRLKRLAPAMLRDWTRSKKTVRHAAFLHAGEFERAR